MAAVRGPYYHGAVDRHHIRSSVQYKGVPNLAQRCDLCGKAPVSGSNVSHSQRHTKRRFRPNIHPATLTIDGKEQRLKVCTRCLRTHYKSAA